MRNQVPSIPVSGFNRAFLCRRHAPRCFVPIWPYIIVLHRRLGVVITDQRERSSFSTLDTPTAEIPRDLLGSFTVCLTSLTASVNKGARMTDGGKKDDMTELAEKGRVYVEGPGCMGSSLLVSMNSNNLI